MTRLQHLALAMSMVSVPAMAATSPMESGFAENTAVKAAEAADDGKCPLSMQIIAADLRDSRFGSLPAKTRGEILTVWARCAQQLAAQAGPSKP